jgi:lauroyl/myristoyl acyltransferase
VTELRERPIELGYAAGWRVIRTMPESVSWSLFRAAADRAARKRGPGTQRLARNLRRVVGPELSEAELDVLVRDGLRSYARYWLQAFRLPSLASRRVLATFRMENGHILGDAVAAGTGCVVALPHAGNWDYAGAWVCANGWKLTTVAERLKPEGVYQRFVAYRESLGMQIVAATGGSRPPLDILVDAIADSHIVALLADRDLSARGIEVDFFGARTRMPAGPALLAIRTGAPLVTVSLWYDGDQPCGRVNHPIPMPDPALGSLDARVRALTQTVADQLAAGIAEHPADWHMLQRLWPDQKALDQMALDQMVPDERVPDERAPDERAPDERAPDERAPDEKVPDEKVPDALLDQKTG